MYPSVNSLKHTRKKFFLSGGQLFLLHPSFCPSLFSLCIVLLIYISLILPLCCHFSFFFLSVLRIFAKKPEGTSLRQSGTAHRPSACFLSFLQISLPYFKQPCSEPVSNHSGNNGNIPADIFSSKSIYSGRIVI